MEEKLGKNFEKAKITEETEVEIVKSIIHDENFFLMFSDHVHPSLFRERFRVVVEIALKYWKQYGKLIPSNILAQELTFMVGSNFSNEKLEATLKTLRDISSPPSSVEYIYSIVEKFIQFKRMENALVESINILSKANKENDAGLLNSIPTLVNRASEPIKIEQPTFFLGDIDARTQFRAILASGEYKQVSFPTGIPPLDELRPWGGLLAGELGLWVGRTGGGKSIALNQCALAAASQGHKVIYFTLEIPENMLTDRMDSAMTGISVYELTKEREKVKELIRSSADMGFAEIVYKYLPSVGTTVQTLRNEIERMKRVHNFIPEVIVVDYLDLLTYKSHKKMQTWEEQMNVSNELRDLGNKVNAGVWSASQGGRGGSQKADDGDVMTDYDIGQSYAKQHVADLVVTMNQSKKFKEMPEPKPMTLFVAKNRTGFSGNRIDILTCFSKMAFYCGDYDENASLQQQAFNDVNVFNKLSN